MTYKTVVLNQVYKDASNCTDDVDAMINQMAAQGWEFMGIANRYVLEKPGCIASLFGKKQIFINVDVAMFKKD